MVTFLVRRVFGVALVCSVLAACHPSPPSAAPSNPATPTTSAPAVTKAQLPANPAMASSVAAPSGVVPKMTWSASADKSPEQVARESAVVNEMVKKYPRLTLQQLDEINTGGTPIYYVMASGQLFYTDAKVDYLMQGGQLIVGVGDNVHNITEEMQQKLAADIYRKLPFEQAIKHVYGKGERQMVMFSDPDCPICQAFEATLESKGAALNATVYTFPFPLVAPHPNSVFKAAYLLCTPNPGDAWHDWMLHASGGWDAWAAKHKSDVGCKRAELAAVGSQLAQRLGLTRTPSLMFPNGTVIPGAPTLEQLEQIWALPGPSKI